MNTTTRKEIQEQRMKAYFLQATKDILKSEGLRSVSVRNIAEKAGYSFATMYNYFKDAKELIFLCVKDFQDECALHVQERTAKSGRGARKLKAIMLAYADYFVQYPGIFELCFIEKLSDISGKQKIADYIVSFPDRLCEEEWQYCLQKELVNKKDIEKIKLQLRTITSGALLLYLNRNSPVSYPEFTQMLGMQLDNTLALLTNK